MHYEDVTLIIVEENGVQRYYPDNQNRQKYKTLKDATRVVNDLNALAKISGNGRNYYPLTIETKVRDHSDVQLPQF